MDHYNFMVTGATGTLGRAVINELLARYDNLNILGISRDEQKQRTMPKDKRLKMRLVDVTDYDAICNAMNSLEDYPDIIFHFAALKCVDSIEENRDAGIKTNVTGTQIICKIANLTGAKVVLASTDKAVYPVNTYGMTKGLSERLVLENKDNCVCRYGNVVGSRGSLIQIIKDSLINKKVAYITDTEMTRFWITLNQARDFVIQCALNDKNGLQIPFYMKSARVTDIIRITAEVLSVEDYETQKIGMRPGEKIHETICTEYERNNAVSSNDFDRIMSQSELRELVTTALGEL